MSNTDIKKRGPRTTKKQLELMTNFICENKIILKAKLEPKEINTVKEKWKELTNMLNASGQGPLKTTTQWKKVFQELKTNTRKRARGIMNSKNKTGGGPANIKELTDVELKILQLLSKVSVEGAEEVIEAGLIDDLDFAEDEVLVDSDIDITEIPAVNLESLINVSERDLIEPMENCTATEIGTPATNIRTSIRKCKPRRHQAKPTNLEIAVNKQVTSTENLSKSIQCLSESIKILASSIEKLAAAIHNKADQ